MQDEMNVRNDKFRIGSVSRLTGIPTDTLRIWERRYQVVNPDRGDTGTRLYSHSDITRLALIKQLVDQGNAISTVANLSKDELESRIKIDAKPVSYAPVAAKVPCKMVVCGDALPLFIRNNMEELSEIEVVAEYQSPYDADKDLADIDANVLLMEFPAFQDMDIGPLQTVLKRHRHLYPILVYGFTTRTTLDLLEKLNISTIRAPLDVYRLKSECQKATGGTVKSTGVVNRQLELDKIPAKQYTQHQLMRLSNIKQADTIECECPKHHADILYNLYAFEDYSVGCQAKSPEDAALHDYLHACTVKARYMMEKSLAKLIETDNLDIG